MFSHKISDNIIPSDKVDLVAIPVRLFCITFRLCAGRYCQSWSESELSRAVVQEQKRTQYPIYWNFHEEHSIAIHPTLAPSSTIKQSNIH